MINFNIESLDKNINCIRNGELVYIMGASGGYKSAFIHNMLYKAIKDNKKVIFFTSDSPELFFRNYYFFERIDEADFHQTDIHFDVNYASEVKAKKFNTDKYSKDICRFFELNNSVIINLSLGNVKEVFGVIELFKSSYKGLDAVFIDSFQHVKNEQTFRNASLGAKKISAELKIAAIKFDAPFIVTNTINRFSDFYKKKMKSIPENDILFSDADKVISLYPQKNIDEVLSFFIGYELKGFISYDVYEKFLKIYINCYVLKDKFKHHELETNLYLLAPLGNSLKLISLNKKYVLDSSLVALRDLINFKNKKLKEFLNKNNLIDFKKKDTCSFASVPHRKHRSITSDLFRAEKALEAIEVEHEKCFRPL